MKPLCFFGLAILLVLIAGSVAGIQTDTPKSDKVIPVYLSPGDFMKFEPWGIQIPNRDGVSLPGFEGQQSFNFYFTNFESPSINTLSNGWAYFYYNKVFGHRQSIRYKVIFTSKNLGQLAISRLEVAIAKAHTGKFMVEGRE